MYVYGAAVAITDDPESPTLNCNFIKAKKGKAAINLGEPKSFKTKNLKLNDRNNTKLEFQRFISTLYEVIQLQAEEAKRAKKAKPLIPVLLGVNGQNKYPIETILPIFFEACRDFVKERGIKIEDLLSKIQIHKGYYTNKFHNKGTTHIPSREEAIEHLIKKQEEPKMQELNKELSLIKADVLKRKPKALRKAERLAASYVFDVLYDLVSLPGGDPYHSFVIFAPNDERLKAIPSLNFLRWHPRIEQAFRRSYALQSGVPNHIVFKCACDQRGEPFTDVVHARIQDIHARIPVRQGAETKEAIEAKVLELIQSCN